MLKNKKQKKINKAAQAFKMAAYSIQRSNHWLGSFYRRIKSKGNSLAATKATARKLAVIFYNMVQRQVEFIPIPIEQYDAILQERKLKYLKKQAMKMGMSLVPSSTGSSEVVS